MKGPEPLVIVHSPWVLVREGDIVVKLERYPSDQSRGGASDAETNESLVGGRDAGARSWDRLRMIAQIRHPCKVVPFFSSTPALQVPNRLIGAISRLWLPTLWPTPSSPLRCYQLGSLRKDNEYDVY